MTDARLNPASSDEQTVPTESIAFPYPSGAGLRHLGGTNAGPPTPPSLVAAILPGMPGARLRSVAPVPPRHVVHSFCARKPERPCPSPGGTVAVTQPGAVALASLLAAAGITHFARPRPYDAIVPRWLPGSPRGWTYVSGAAELALAAAIARPRTRRGGSLAAAVLFAAVFPANVQMAVDWRHRPMPQRAVAYGRLPLQVPLIWWALRVAGART